MRMSCCVPLLLAVAIATAQELDQSRLWDAEKRLAAQVVAAPENAALGVQLAKVRSEIGQAKMKAGDYSGAMDYLYSAVRLDGSNPGRWQSLGDAAKFSGQPGADYLVQWAYEEALRIAPNDTGVRVKLAAAYASSERYQKAMGELEKAFTESRQPMEWNAVMLLVGLYAQNNQLARGAQFLDSLQRAQPAKQYKVACAILENSAGNRDRAVGLLRALESAEPPGSAWAQYAATLRQSYEGTKGR